MSISHSAQEIKSIIHQAIKDNKLTHRDYDRIMEIAYQDGYLDEQERNAIAYLRDLIEDKTVCITEDRDSPTRCD